MIITDSTKGATIKEIKERDKKMQEASLLVKCNTLANEKYGEEEMKKKSNANKGIWFLPVMDDAGEIDKMALMKPIDRNILSYASTKITDEGLYAFLEAAMRECFIDGDNEILDDDEYFIPAANSFNKILEGKKAFLVKR
jgi:hypothetical protein